MSSTSTAWAEKMEMLRAVKPAELAQTILTDPSLAEAEQRAAHAVRDAQNAASRRISQEHAADTTGESPWDPITLSDAIAADPAVILAKDAWTAAVAAREAAEVEFFFRAIPGPAYERLVAAHPPSDEDRAAGKRVNEKTFAPAVVQASHVFRTPLDPDPITGEPRWEESPGMSLEDAEYLFETWSLGDQQTLYSCAVAVNQVSRFDAVSLGKGFGPTTH